MSCDCCEFRIGHSLDPCECGGEFCLRCLRCGDHCRCEESRHIKKQDADTAQPDPSVSRGT